MLGPEIELNINQKKNQDIYISFPKCCFAVVYMGSADHYNKINSFSSVPPRAEVHPHPGAPHPHLPHRQCLHHRGCGGGEIHNSHRCS